MSGKAIYLLEQVSDMLECRSGGVIEYKFKENQEIKEIFDFVDYFGEKFYEMSKNTDFCSDIKPVIKYCPNEIVLKVYIKHIAPRAK